MWPTPRLTFSSQSKSRGQVDVNETGKCMFPTRKHGGSNGYARMYIVLLHEKQTYSQDNGLKFSFIILSLPRAGINIMLMFKIYRFTPDLSPYLLPQKADLYELQ